MIKLTDRLQAIAKDFKTGETMADIGTDHGFLPIYLWENSICPHVIMTDISPFSLDKARVNAKNFHPGKEFDFRTGNGLSVLEEDEVTGVVIAGMGGLLITEILAKDVEKSRSFDKFILQPRNNEGILRYWLLSNGFKITKEKLVRERRFICDIIFACPVEDGEIIKDAIGDEEGSISWDIPIQVASKNHIYEEYLIRLYERECGVLEGMKKAISIDSVKEEAQKHRIAYMKELLEEERVFYERDI